MSNRLKGQRILLVEDDMILAMELEDLLFDLGCEVVGPFAELGRLMPVVAAEALDGAIMDLNLRGELSYPAIEALRARNVPVLVASGYADLPAVRKRLEGIPLLGKPYDLDRVRQTALSLFASRDNSSVRRAESHGIERG